MQINLSDSGMRRASMAEWKHVADITGDGFSEDPINTWAFGNPRAILSAMRTLAREIYLKHGFSHLHGDDGATMWLAPGTEAKFGSLAMLKFAIGQMRYGEKGAVARATELSKQMDKHHPKDPHMYLFTIATRKTSRGKGVGKALLAPVLDHCDRKGIPVYLENSNPDNTGFYGAHGFERMTLFNVGGDGPVMEPMWREPKTQS